MSHQAMEETSAASEKKERKRAVSLLPGYPERMAAVEWARVVGLKKAVEVISDGGCYEEVFKAALEDVGQPDMLVAILYAIGNPKWAYYCALFTPDLRDRDIETLARIAIERDNPIWAYWFHRDVPRIPKRVSERLREVTES